MKWKTLLQTIVFSIVLFFIVIYLGMKFEWVQALKDKKAEEEASLAFVIPKKTPVTPQASTVSDTQKQLEALGVNKNATVEDNALTAKEEALDNDTLNASASEKEETLEDDAFNASALAAEEEDTLDDETLNASVSVTEDALDDDTFNAFSAGEDALDDETLNASVLVTEEVLDDDIFNASAAADTLDAETLNVSTSLVQEDTLAEKEEKHSEALSLESNNVKEGNERKAFLVEEKVSNKEEKRRVVKPVKEEKKQVTKPPTKEEKKRVVTPAKQEKGQVVTSIKEKNEVKENNSPRVSSSLRRKETQLIDFSGMSLARVVAECRRLSNKIGVPREQLNQSVNECTTRNFQGDATNDVRRSLNVNITLRKQCKAKIPPEQHVLFSPEEMQLLIEECVADLRRNK